MSVSHGHASTSMPQVTFFSTSPSFFTMRPSEYTIRRLTVLFHHLRSLRARLMLDKHFKKSFVLELCRHRYRDLVGPIKIIKIMTWLHSTLFFWHLVATLTTSSSIFVGFSCNGSCDGYYWKFIFSWRCFFSGLLFLWCGADWAHLWRSLQWQFLLLRWPDLTSLTVYVVVASSSSSSTMWIWAWPLVI